MSTTTDEESGKKNLEKTGIKMKAKGELGYEPSLLVLMEREMDKSGCAGYLCEADHQAACGSSAEEKGVPNKVSTFVRTAAVSLWE